MKKLHRTVPYLQVVTQDGTAPDLTPPRPAGVSERDWLIFLHGPDIRAGRYDYWLCYGGPFVPDAVLKAQGCIPPDWTFHPHRDRVILWDCGARSTQSDSTPPE
jgi:hypothetical protein